MSNGFLAMDELITVVPYTKRLTSESDLRDFSNHVEFVNDTKYMLAEDYEDLTHRDWVDGDYESFDTELEAVEEWAEQNGQTADESAATAEFEQHLIDSMDTLTLLKARDTTDVDTWFSDWADSQTRDNQLHMAQYSSYEYVGDFDSFVDTLVNNSGEL